MNFRTRNQMAARRAAQRKRPDRIISILLILSLLFGNLAGFPSAAAELTSYCGKEEHVHTEECYKVAVTTEPTETEGGEETTSETTEAMEETEAAQTVILFDTPVCGKEEHTHTLKCYSNPDADVETAADWEATLPETLTGTWADDLLATVKSQVGYKESVENFIVEDDGETISGYNRYGGWYSGYIQEENQPYLPWNITFLFFSIYYSNIDDFPLEETCPDWIDSLDYYGLYRAAGEYIPNPGDLVFVDTDGDGEADRVGVASEVKDNKLIAIEGDYEGAVAEVTYDLPELTVEPETTETEGTTEIDVSVSMNALLLLSDGTEEGDEAPQPTVVGYGDTNEAQAQIEVSGGEDAPVLMANMEWTHSSYLYLDISSMPDWKNAGARIVLAYNDGDSDWSFAQMTECSTNMFQIDIPDNMVLGQNSKFKFVRMKSSGDFSWDNMFNDIVSDLTLDNINSNVYKLTGWYGESGKANGQWENYVKDPSSSSSSGGGGGTVTGTVVDINSEDFSPADDTYYVNASFYDYYTDYELDGNNRDGNTSWGGDTFPSDANWYVFDDFNAALSEYYFSKGVMFPLYMGHFQPDWTTNNEAWGFQFKNYKNHDLYGFMSTEAYGAENNDQKWFMSVNNSNMDLTPTIGHVNSAAQGLVNSALVNDSLVSVNKSGGTVAMPLFDAGFISGTSEGRKLGDVYSEVSFPFTKDGDPDEDGVEYWVFDSEDTTLEMKKDSNSGNYFLEDVGHQDWSINLDSASVAQTRDNQYVYGFFPFNSGKTTASFGNANTYNYGFGCRLDIPFRLTEDGMVLTNIDTDNDGKADNRIPIEFEFSGDDDVWVFIDGNLALDIGGSHGKVTGSLNFATMKATVSATKTNPGSRTEGTNVQNDFTISGTNTDEHVLTMFYMERGMWESNMKITFNFPDENQLEVEKNVDDSDVNALFNGVFDNQKMFTFNIKNLATHFADVAANGATHDAIAWNVSGSTLSKDPSNTFDRGTYCNKENALHWKAQYDDTSSVYRHKRYGVLSLPDTVDISDMTKLSFNIYVEDNSGFSLSDMYLQILDADVAIEDLIDKTLTAGNDNAMGCIGTSLSGKTYGSVSTAGNQWVKVTLDLSKMKVGTDFDKMHVQHLRFGYDYSRNIYLQGFTFEPAAKASNPTGFITQQYDVPSYGSATSGALENAAGAVYTSTLNARASYVVDQSGNFALQNGEIVNFHDQFRRGSYIRLEEVLTEQEKALYDTSWTMYENDNAVTSFGTGTTSTNPSTIPDMTDVKSEVVTDGRVEKVVSGEVDGHPQLNKYTTENNPGAFLFRSYANPDSTATTTKLKVVYTNKVKTADLTIRKEDGTDTIDSSKTFTFVIEFYNVGGLGLENGKITTVVSLNAGEETTITEIPVNTQYTIYELKTDSDIVLDHVSGAHTTFTPTTYSGTAGVTTYTNQDAYSVSGSIGTDNKSVKFTNVKKPTISVKATKTWLDAEGKALQDPPNTIYLCLLQRKAGDGDNAWKPYVSASGYEGYQNVTFTPGYGAWEYTFTPLDVYVNYPSEQTKWEYKVVELDANGNVIAENGTITIGENDYTVTYDPDVVSGNVNANGTVMNSVATQTITNKLKPKAKVTVTKAWNVPTGVTKPDVTVQLQRRTGSNDFAAIDGLDNVTLSATNEWTHTFEGLDEMDSNNVAYDYRVVELNGETAIEANGTFNVDDIAYRVTYSGDGKATLVENTTNEYTQTITNSAVPEVTLQITKLDATDTTKKLDGVVFKLEKKDDNTFTAMEVTTGENGIASFAGLKAGTYQLTETKTADGYSLLKSSITIVITESTDATSGAITYTATVDNNSDVSFELSGNTYTLAMTIYNKQNLTMPATGGVNGFEFWILGGLCMMAVPLLLYTFFWFKKGGKYLRK